MRSYLDTKQKIKRKGERMNYEKWDAMTDTEREQWRERQYYIRSIIAAIIGALIVTLVLR